MPATPFSPDSQPSIAAKHSRLLPGTGAFLLLLALAAPAGAEKTDKTTASTQPTTSQPKAASAKAAKSKAATRKKKPVTEAAFRLPKSMSIEQRVGILTDEVQRLRERLVIPEKNVYKSVYGLGPAASRVYLLQRGLSVGGYGEYYLQRKIKDKRTGQEFNTGDALRYVQYLGYKFTDKLIMNAEIEVEHSTTGRNWEDKSGSVSLEFGYLDYLFHPAINLRFGVLLVPLGFINEIHEPPFFHGVLRPAVEQVIIPTTWRELGFGLFGQILPGLSYKLYVVNGFNASNFSDKGWRDGRQSGGRVLAEDFALAARIDYRRGDLVNVGVGIYYGGAEQNRVENVDARTLLMEGHVQVRYRGFEFRFLGAWAQLSDARALTLALFPDSTDPAKPETRVIASQMNGWYGEVAYDFWPLISASNLYLAPYFRFERYNTQFDVPEIAGRIANPERYVSIVEAGLTFKPHPQVAVKLTYRDQFDGAGSQLADSLLLGVGFIY